MVKDVIDKAIKTDGIVEFEYSKDGLNSKFYRLCKVHYSAEYGDRCFCGCPYGTDTELTFRIDRVEDFQLVWYVILEENIQFEKSGIYAFSFMGDNYIDFGVYTYNKGEKLLDHYQFNILDILAYHYLPFYSETDKNQWNSFNKAEKVEYDSIYIFAYTMEEGVNVNLDERFDFLLHTDHFKSTEYSGIHYTLELVRKGYSFKSIMINDKVNILAYHSFPIYSYYDLGVHNNLRDEKWGLTTTKI